MISEQDQAQEQAMVLARLAIRDAALEEAAKVADGWTNGSIIAEEIRALKSTARKMSGD